MEVSSQLHSPVALPPGTHWTEVWVGMAGTHPDFCPMGIGGFPPGREADHSLPSSVDVKNAWSYTSTSQYVIMA
jgi:hypothetical protein